MWTPFELFLWKIIEKDLKEEISPTFSEQKKHHHHHHHQKKINERKDDDRLLPFRVNAAALGLRTMTHYSQSSALVLVREDAHRTLIQSLSRWNVETERKKFETLFPLLSILSQLRVTHREFLSPHGLSLLTQILQSPKTSETLTSPFFSIILQVLATISEEQGLHLDQVLVIYELVIGLLRIECEHLVANPRDLLIEEKIDVLLQTLQSLLRLTDQTPVFRNQFSTSIVPLLENIVQMIEGLSSKTSDIKLCRLVTGILRAMSKTEAVVRQRICQIDLSGEPRIDWLNRMVFWVDHYHDPELLLNVSQIFEFLLADEFLYEVVLRRIGFDFISSLAVHQSADLQDSIENILGMINQRAITPKNPTTTTTISPRILPEEEGIDQTYLILDD